MPSRPHRVQHLLAIALVVMLVAPLAQAGLLDQVKEQVRRTVDNKAQEKTSNAAQTATDQVLSGPPAAAALPGAGASMPPPGPRISAPSGRPVWSVKAETRDVAHVATADGVVTYGATSDSIGIVAHSLADGRRLWAAGTFRTTAIAAGEGVVAAVVHCTDSGCGSDWRVVAHDLKTGRELWRRPVNARGNSPRNGLGIGIAAGKLLVPDFGDSRLLALDPRTGTQAWSFVYGAGPGHCERPAVAAGDTIYWSGGEDDQAFDTRQEPQGHFLFALDAASGKLRWKTEIRINQDDRVGACIGTPFADGGRVYASADGVVFASDAQTGRVLWRTALQRRGSEDGLYGALSDTRVYGGIVAVAAFDAVWGLDASSGRVAWVYDLPANGRVLQSYWHEPMASVDGQLFASVAFNSVNGAGEIHALDARTGSLVRKTVLPGWGAKTVRAAPAGVVADTQGGIVRVGR